MEVDFLARLALLDEHGMAPELHMEIQQSNIEGQQTMSIQAQDDWTTPIMLFLKEG